ncbi:MAG: OmpH family outer membrane protein [Fuerstiella sp.]|nr:OmpH family outer membrane protein [Fuerstiella sp.]
MKRLPLILSLLTFAILATGNLAEAQDRRPSQQKKAAVTKVGLIDMAHVFQNYEKFKELREALQAAVQQSDTEAQEMASKFKALQEQLSQQSKDFDPGSPEYENIERQLLDEKAKFESWRAATQRKLARRETEMLKTIYADVSKMVKAYAEYAEYSLVLRFNRKNVDNEMQPQQAIQAMNKNVIYHQNGNDITEIVLKQLNNQFSRKSGRTPTQSAGNRKPVNR